MEKAGLTPSWRAARALMASNALHTACEEGRLPPMVFRPRVPCCPQRGKNESITAFSRGCRLGSLTWNIAGAGCNHDFGPQSRAAGASRDHCSVSFHFVSRFAASPIAKNHEVHAAARPLPKSAQSRPHSFALRVDQLCLLLGGPLAGIALEVRGALSHLGREQVLQALPPGPRLFASSDSHHRHL